MAGTNVPQNSSAAAIENDLERHSIDIDSDVDSLDIIDIEVARRDRTMKEKGDIEAYPDGGIKPQDEPWVSEPAKGKDSKGLAAVLSRMSTKSSWKDPGPPPDGGTKAWMQGVYYFSS